MADGFFDDPKPTTPPPVDVLPVDIAKIAIAGLANDEHIVVLFGSERIGKTVSLLRLCKYARTDYAIVPNTTFRADKEYESVVKDFESIRENWEKAPKATGKVNFLMLDVTHKGRKFCRLLEAPGEHFFSEQNPTQPYPPYFDTLTSANYAKIYIFYFTLTMFGNDRMNTAYADKIATFIRTKLGQKDKVIILCNKCDEQGHLYSKGKPVVASFQKELYNAPWFASVKHELSNSGLGTVPFVTFSSGSFHLTNDGYTYVMGHNDFPARLWETIHNCIAGKPWWQFW